MRVLIIGSGGGSWQVRGVQLGRALGAQVTSRPTEAQIREADVIVLVKRALWQHIDDIRAMTNACVVWDAVDFWRQPDENVWPIADCVQRVRAVQEQYRISLVIGTTQAMAEAVGGVYLPHHHRPGLFNAPARQQLRTLAYEGTKKYLGSWGKALLTVCASIDLNLLINPPDLRLADVVVAFRGEQWDGAVCREWKSGVKLVNAIAAGRPVISQTSAAWREIQPEGTLVDDPVELEAAVRSWMPYETRERARVSHEMRTEEFSLGTMAQAYHRILDRVWRQAA